MTNKIKIDYFWNFGRLNTSTSLQKGETAFKRKKGRKKEKGKTVVMIDWYLSFSGATEKEKKTSILTQFIAGTIKTATKI